MSSDKSSTSPIFPPQVKAGQPDGDQTNQVNQARSATKSTNKKDRDKDEGFEKLSNLFNGYQVKQDQGYITREFQDYGYRLAMELDDLEHKGLYIKLAKQENRGLLEQARQFVSDAKARSRAKLFMWKLQQLKQELKQTEPVSPEQPSLPEPEQS